jgi:hypothetical protein
MVFLAQFILSLSMGSIINHVQSTTAVVVAASVLSFCGAISANFVEYLGRQLLFSICKHLKYHVMFVSDL